MDYITNNTSYSITGLPIPDFSSGSYNSVQQTMYENAIKYSRQIPEGEYR